MAIFSNKEILSTVERALELTQKFDVTKLTVSQIAELELTGTYLMRAACHNDSYTVRRGLEKMGAATFMLSQYLEAKNSVQIHVKIALVLQNAAIIKRNIDK